MSSAIILPIYYDRQMRRRTNRREIFIKRFTSGCVVVATLFIVVGLSSSTWYMTILGTFILMIVGLSGFCLKYCDRTADNRAVRRAISISSRIQSERRPENRSNDDLPPAYDNIVFDTTSYHISTDIRSYDNPVAPPPPYEAIFNAANHPANTNVSAPTYSSIPRRSTSVPATLIVPRFSVESDRQSVCLSHAIGLTITSSSQNPESSRTAQLEPYHGSEQDISEPVEQDPQLITSEQVHVQSEQVTEQATLDNSTDTPQSVAQQALQTITRQSSLVNAQEISHTVTPQTQQSVTPDTSSSVVQTALQTSMRQSSLSSEQGMCQATRAGDAGSAPSFSDLSEQTVPDMLNVVTINNAESVSSDDHIDLTSDSNSGSSNI